MSNLRVEIRYPCPELDDYRHIRYRWKAATQALRHGRAETGTVERKCLLQLRSEPRMLRNAVHAR